MRIALYVHADELDAYNKAEKAGITGEALKMAAFLGYEHRMEYEVDPRTGEGKLVAVDGPGIAIEVKCDCGSEYLCSFCGLCLVHTHQRAWRSSQGREGVRQFYVDPRETFVNPGWHWTEPGCDEWFWYHPRNGCWRRALPG